MESHSSRAALRKSSETKLMPPSPCRTSMAMAQMSVEKAARRAATSLKGMKVTSASGAKGSR